MDRSFSSAVLQQLWSNGRETQENKVPWETLSLNIGVFFSSIDSSFGIGGNNIDFFFLEYDNYEGSIIDIKLAVEYNLFKNVGFGLGYEHLEVDVEAHDSSYPGMNFNGNLLFDYSGIQLYTKIYF